MLTQRLAAVAFALTVTFASVSAKAQPAVDPPVAIVPLPHSVEQREGRFALTAETRLIVPKGDGAAAQAADVLRERLNTSAGLPLPAAEGDGGEAVPGAILLTTRGADDSLGSEGYTLEVRPDSVVIRSAGAAGLFYGVQSFLQLLPAAAYGDSRAPATTRWTAACVSIRDRPRFPWRGAMLDVSRHLFKKDEIFRLLDTMAMHKQNVFHWHLTDDQGWRIEIKKYPKLTEQAAWRDDIGFGLDPKLSEMYDAKGRYGGFFSQDDVREVVAYAAARQITVVPEIEMPGHSSASLAAYPEHGCVGETHSTRAGAGVFAGVYCAGTDKTFAFLQDVLDEVIPLFPSQYIHVGGDEVPKEGWKACERCQARIKAESLKDEHELQSYFIRRIEKHLNARGKRLIGWDEILEGGLAPDATVMSWRGVKGGIAAARAGHDTVMSPTSHCYLDYHQTASGETAPIGPLLPLEKVYAYEPVPPELTPEQAKHVRGVQGNLWTEFVPNFAHAGCMQYPRLSAIAEIGWSKPGPRDFDDFQRRVAQNELRLDALGMTYRPLPPAGIEQAIRAGDGGRFTIAMPAEGLTRHYTTDGSDPTQQSARYEQPVELPTAGLATVRARFFRPGTRIGYYDEQTFVNGLPLTVETTLRQHEGHAMTRAFDGKLETFFWHNRAVRKDDHLTLRFSEPRAMRSIVVKTGKPDGSGDRLADGALEVSRGGGAFAAVAEFRDGAAEAALDGAPIDAVRIRARAASTQWLVIREITLR